MFTVKDKIAKLQRLGKQVDMWSLQAKILPMVESDRPGLFIGSREFKEWQSKVTAAITLIFGEHSRYVDDFNEIAYTSIFATLSPGGPQRALLEGLANAKRMLQTMVDEIKSTEETSSFAATKAEETSSIKQSVFIGHGRSPLWLDVRRVLGEEWGLGIVSFESEPRTSKSISQILTDMLDRACFAVIVLTAEDVTASGEARGRQNVIHEAGLSQGKLGLEKVVILKQEGVEEPSNLAGLQYISFPGARIEKGYYELQRALKREGLISRAP